MAKLRRPAIEDAIALLIDALDALDPDPDLEPTMGFVMPGEVDEAEPDADLEPSLGAPEVEFLTASGKVNRHGHIDQRRWADGGSAHDDAEPTLGAPYGAPEWHCWPGQLAWAQGYQRDPERDEIEDVSEDEGADVQSQPHDEDTDKEPTIGALEAVDQTSWGGSGTFCADEGEPSLGAPESPHDQRRWSQGDKGSQELDHDERSVSAPGAYDRSRRIRSETEAMLRRKGLAQLASTIPLRGCRSASRSSGHADEPRPEAGRLNTIADDIDAVRRLVEAAGMACAGLDANERDPLDELLATIAERLHAIADARRPPPS